MQKSARADRVAVNLKSVTIHGATAKRAKSKYGIRWATASINECMVLFILDKKGVVL
jgi:hypothetical protein